MTVIDNLYEYALDKSEYILPKELFLNALFFNTASAMGINNMRIHRLTNSGIKSIIPSYYGISFAPSGAGKNHSRDITRSLFSYMFKKWVSECDGFNNSRKGEDGKFDKRYIKLTDYYVPISSSVEGIQKAAQTVADLQKGSINCTTDELGDVMGKIEPIITKLKTAWDSGIAEGQVNVQDGNDNYFTVEDVCFNALLFGSPAPFELDHKKKDKLLEYYVSGMARRSFIYHNSHYRKSENRNTLFEKKPSEFYTKIDNYIKELDSFLRHTKVIILPESIREKLIEYDIQKESIRDSSNSLIAEDLGNPKKIEKLLGILATLDLSETITQDHLDFAIKFTEACDATAQATVEIKPIYISIYEELEKRSFTARTDIIKAVRDVTLRTLDDEMTLVEEHASMIGNSVLRQENSGIVTYKLEKMSKSSLSNVIISHNESMEKFVPTGFIRNEGKFENMHRLTNGPYRYSAGTFMNGHISDENYLKEQNLFIIDIDNDLTIEEAKSLFHDYTYLISTTRNHQKEKHGITCDRFRLILPTVSKFHLEPKLYSQMYLNVLNALGLAEADQKCKNVSRWYYGNPEGDYWYNNGPQLLDIRPYIPSSAENLKASKALSNLEDMDESDAPQDSRVAGALRWFLSSTTNGNRSDNLFRFAMLLKDSTRINCADWEAWTLKANSMLAEPMKKSEIAAIVKSADRRYR